MGSLKSLAALLWEIGLRGNVQRQSVVSFQQSRRSCWTGLDSGGQFLSSQLPGCLGTSKPELIRLDMGTCKLPSEDLV
jgi:hypothetical protein